MTSLSGYLDNGAHFFPLRIYIQHTDIGGVVYHSRYLDFAEQARTEFLRLLGVPHHLIRKEEQGFIVVRDCHVSYLMPARLDDFLEVRTTLKRVGGASIIVGQDILREKTPLVQIKIRLGWIKPTGFVARLPKRLHHQLVDFLATHPPTEGT